jgi:hypothetical protein
VTIVMDAARGDGLSMPSSTVVPPNDLRDSVTETAGGGA